MIKPLADKFFKWYCNPYFYEDIKGDLDELYLRQLSNRSKRTANIQFAIEVLLLFRPSIIRPFKYQSLNYIIDMLTNYLKIGLRNLMKHPAYTFTHILGLALGLTAFLFINQYTNFEKQYDQFHPMPDQLVRLTTDDVKDDVIQVRDAMSFAPSGKALMEELPEITGYTTTYKTWQMILKKGETPVEESDIIAVDSNFLYLFGYEVLQGNKATMFNDPYTIVLSASQAAAIVAIAPPKLWPVIHRGLLDLFNPLSHLRSCSLISSRTPPLSRNS